MGRKDKNWGCYLRKCMLYLASADMPTKYAFQHIKLLT